MTKAIQQEGVMAFTHCSSHWRKNKVVTSVKVYPISFLEEKFWLLSLGHELQVETQLS